MEQITAYRANDGTIFDTADEATAHEAGTDFDTWYKVNVLTGSQPGSYVYLSDFKKYITDNAEQIQKLLP